MRAIVQEAYGDADVLRPAERPLPRALRDDEVLVRVHAAGLDRGTWHLMTGTPYAVRLVMGLRRPRQPVPGLDLAGTVAAVGAAVTRFAPGDEVYGIGTGTFAEYAVAKEGKLAAKPATLTHEQAATVPVSAITALQAVTDLAEVQAGQRVLVTGASGGVGSYAVQIAVAAGAEVTGVASAAKADLVRSLGATHVLDYASDDFADGPGPLRRDHRHRRQRLAVPAAPGADADRHGGARGRRGRRPPHRHEPPAPRARRLPVRAPAPHDAGPEGERQRPRAALRADRGRSGHAERGRDVPARPRPPTAMRDLVAGQVRGKVAITVLR